MKHSCAACWKPTTDDEEQDWGLLGLQVPGTYEVQQHSSTVTLCPDCFNSLLAYVISLPKPTEPTQ